MGASRCVRTRRAAAVLAATGAAVLCTGCENAGQGALSGAALGAGAGAIIGSLSGNFGEGAAIGAVVGALGGGIVGDQNARRAAYGYSPAPAYTTVYDPGYGCAPSYGGVSIEYGTGYHHYHGGYHYSRSRYRY